MRARPEHSPCACGPGLSTRPVPITLARAVPLEGEGGRRRPHTFRGRPGAAASALHYGCPRSRRLCDSCLRRCT
eukprot:742481-Pleurochrysis_carterae.AAC.1